MRMSYPGIPLEIIVQHEAEVEHIHFIKVEVRVIRKLPVGKFGSEQYFRPKVPEFIKMNKEVEVQMGIVRHGIFVRLRIQDGGFPVPAETEDRLNFH
jgi:hypothetical protein